MKQLRLKFTVSLMVLLVAACGNAATNTVNEPTKETNIADLRNTSTIDIIDDDLYTAMDIFKNPNKTEQDYKQAHFVFNELALRGNLKAKYALGIWYADENNPEYDVEQAIHYYTQAASGGIVDAQNDLGIAFIGAKKGFPKKISEAEFWLLKAANGSSSTSTMYNLGILYYHEVSPPNYEKSIYWFDKAAGMGDAISSFYYVQAQAKRLLPKVNYELGYYRACVLKRYQAENPSGWAALVKRQPEAEKILDVSGAVLEHGLKEQDITRIQRQAISVDLSNELK